MDITKFLREGSKFLAADRPDIFDDIEDAFSTLSTAYSTLAGNDDDGEISFAGFVLQKFYRDGVVEYHLHRRILEYQFFTDEDEVVLKNWTTCSALSNIGLDVPLDEDGL